MSVVGLEKGPDKLGIALEELVEHLTVVDVVTSLGLHGGRCIVEQLVFSYRLDVHLLVESLEWCRVNVG